MHGIPCCVCVNMHMWADPIQVFQLLICYNHDLLVPESFTFVQQTQDHRKIWMTGRLIWEVAFPKIYVLISLVSSFPPQLFFLKPGNLICFFYPNIWYTRFAWTSFPQLWDRGPTVKISVKRFLSYTPMSLSLQDLNFNMSLEIAAFQKGT